MNDLLRGSKDILTNADENITWALFVLFSWSCVVFDSVLYQLPTAPGWRGLASDRFPAGVAFR